jgi:hypothetical protein
MAVGQSVPEMIRQSVRLTRFAVFTRSPGLAPPIDHEEYREALAIAEAVLRWVEEQV